MRYLAKLTTKHATFWLSGKGHWLSHRDQAFPFASRRDAYRAAARTNCVQRKWGDKVSLELCNQEG